MKGMSNNEFYRLAPSAREYKQDDHTSPAVATYGLRKSVEQADRYVHDFVNHNFYVDDGLKKLQMITQLLIPCRESRRPSLKEAICVFIRERQAMKL
ncbi:hypothetical protein SK128_002645 [Halocaridina rubra]|uniref:Uncharacterized protein n=1 Tax=Halocaridina rubra TaxID=373956 RepID=A0AAN8XEY7_HALRR